MVYGVYASYIERDILLIRRAGRGFAFVTVGSPSEDASQVLKSLEGLLLKGQVISIYTSE